MESGVRVSGIEASRLLETLAEVGSLAPDDGLRAVHVIHRIAEIVGADAGVVGTMRWPSKPARLRCRWGWGVDAVTFDSMRCYFDEHWTDPSASALGQAAGGLAVGETVALCRQNAVPANDWYASDAVQSHFRRWALDTFICGLQRIDEADRYAVLLLYRGWEAPTYSADECRLVELLWSHAPGLMDVFADGTGRDGGDSGPLPPRLAQVLWCLHAGYSTKRIAASLGLSVHTVYDHFKRLRERFGVTTRMELLTATRGMSETAGHDGKEAGDGTAGAARPDG